MFGNSLVMVLEIFGNRIANPGNCWEIVVFWVYIIFISDLPSGAFQKTDEAHCQYNERP